VCVSPQRGWMGWAGAIATGAGSLENAGEGRGGGGRYQVPIGAGRDPGRKAELLQWNRVTDTPSWPCKSPVPPNSWFCKEIL
jgi:hypothetical protein